MKSGVDVKSLKAGGALPIVAVVLALLALWFAFTGWQVWSANHLVKATEEARKTVAGKVTPLLGSLGSKAAALSGRADLATAMRAGNTDAAKAIVSQAVPGTEAVEVVPPGFAQAYADPNAFGYGKLALLERASQEGRPAIGVIKDGGGPRLGVAVSIVEGAQVLGVVYLREPLTELSKLAEGAAPSGGYVALRQGSYNVFEAGDVEALRARPEAAPEMIGGTQMRVVSMAPDAEAGKFGAGGLGEFGIAAFLLLLGVGLFFWSKRAAKAPLAKAAADAAAATAPAEPTLAELHAAGKAAAPPPQPKAPSTAQQAAMAGIALDRSIFRAYDIRGLVGVTLDANIARLIGQAIGSVMHEKNQKQIVVGRDGRLSSGSMAAGLIEGLRKAGREVIDIGEVPTPLAYFGSFHLRTGCCVEVTGSHNPPDYNGFKIVIDGETLSGDAIANLYGRIAENRLHRAEGLGLLSSRDIKLDYIQRIADDIQIERKLKVVADCGSGVAGAVVPELLAAIGAEVEPLYCDVDGMFPHHHPDPSDPANLVDLINMVQRTGADLGLAFDGDGDRLGVVTKSGEIIYPDRLLMLFASDVLERNPGACVIYDVKCTGNLASHILRHGGSPLMWKTGHSLIKSKMKETEAELAGEMSGHFFFRERWYGFDDGLYSAARLLEILAAAPDDPEEVFAQLPKSVSTPEIKVEVAEGDQYRIIDEFVAKAKFEGARIATIDGVRADWPDGWGLVRASNTTPNLVMRFEAKDADALARVQGIFREQLLAVAPSLSLPF
jgi:phosphomannomutase/phosphoglucomutase